MTLPRQIVPNATYLVSRRTARRHFLLRPDSAMRELIVYMLALAAAQFGIVILAFIAMSDHIQLVLTDTRGELPDFLQWFHRIVALCTKVMRGWDGTVWDDRQTSVVELTTPEAIVDAVGYVIANPVAAGLVKSAREWPGAKSHPNDLGGGRMRASRPHVYIDVTTGQWPEHAVLELGLPPSVAPSEADAWREAAKASIAEHEANAHRDLAANGRKYLGARRAEKVSPYDRATSFEPLRDRNPTFAVGGVPGAYAAAVRALRAFRAAYAAALERWRAGFREVLFPLGTWWMVRWHSASVVT